MRGVLGVLVLVFAVGCERPRVVGLGDGALSVPDSLSFEPTALNYSRVAPLVLTNRTRVPVTLTVATAAPFSLSTGEVTVPGGGELSLEVTFAPVEVGLHEGSLALGGLNVALRGEGVTPPACGAAGPCEVVRFDAEQLRCVRETASDGSACADPAACVDQGACRAGVCLGQVARCDDANPCTSDACAVGVGCQHAAVQCAAPTNPCLAARCDPVLGCTSGPVADGTPCGTVTCEEANVCLGGACRAVTPPDGFTCAEASLCQAEGACRQRTCVRPAPAPIEPRWSYSTGTWLRFEGLHDEAGNWYWLECGLRCEAVSFTANGFERFRHDVGIRAGAAQLLVRDLYLVAGEGLIAVGQSDGRVVWGALSGEQVEALATDGSGLGWAATHDANGWWLVRFSVAAGQVLDRLTIGGAPRKLLLDELGRPHVAWTSAGMLVSGYASFDTNGVLRHSQRIGTETPLYVTGSRLVWTDDSERSTDDGQVLSPHGNALPAVAGLASGGQRWRTEWDGQLRPPKLHLDRIDALAQTTRVLDVESDGSFAGFLTRNGSLLLVSSWERAHARLLPPAGNASETCELQDVTGSPLFAGSLLGFNGKWLAITPLDIDIFDHLPGQRLLFYEVPELGLAPVGWVNARGTPQGWNRPRSN